MAENKQQKNGGLEHSTRGYRATQTLKDRMVQFMQHLTPEQLDVNGDGELTEEDWSQLWSTMMADFASADTNLNGSLDPKEWEALPEKQGKFDAYDVDGSGEVDAEEWVSGQVAEAKFNSADADQDGKLTREEWVAKFGNDDMFDLYDLDRNGVIDPEEFLLAEIKLREFDQMDGNVDASKRDGKIDRDEWVAKVRSSCEMHVCGELLTVWKRRAFRRVRYEW
eukprot:TRINITY_DN2114_c0_g1_i17.p2 TRINITY_DN2114_c0_g1~~TRINITY_DN2114_c0_g1_i17.p2  ORF type:complete len:223 (-),score=69.81 TRINITY_DN2114_c0_g1_i17:1234-1902(-)